MSEAHNEHHEGPIKTPKQLIAAVVAAFLIPIIGIIMLANYVNADKKVGAGSSMDASEAANNRIKPVAQLELKDPSAPRTLKTGEAVYKEACAACHGTGAAGAPKVGANGDWAPRLGQGLAGLLKSAIAGKNAMPARGGTSADDYNDTELARAIAYMANQSGGKFEEPAAPAAPAGGAALAADAGKKVYESTCAACHGTGAAGAPKFGDKAAWASRKGDLVASALKGKNAMPPKGGFAGSDEEFKAAVNYLVSAAK